MEYDHLSCVLNAKHLTSEKQHRNTGVGQKRLLNVFVNDFTSRYVNKSCSLVLLFHQKEYINANKFVQDKRIKKRLNISVQSSVGTLRSKGTSERKRI